MRYFSIGESDHYRVRFCNVTPDEFVAATESIGSSVYTVPVNNQPRRLVVSWYDTIIELPTDEHPSEFINDLAEILYDERTGNLR